jgi:hypothetical protein
MTLEEEIQIATDRINIRTTEFETKISELETKILDFTKWAWGFVYGGFIIVALGLIIYFCKDINAFGLNLLGDFYGGSVASIWSLAGLFFIYVAFLGQKQQLLYQQMEIMYSQLEVKYTRLELEGQKQEMMEQNSTLRQQRFENTFFQLLRNHQDIVNDIDIRRKLSSGESSVSQQGRDCFKTFYEKFCGTINKNSPPDKTNQAYMRFYHGHQSDLGHYFRNLYHILKFINGAKEIIEDDKFKYTSLLRALLSSYELALLFHNCLGDYGNEFFKPLVEKYSFLKNLDEELIMNQTLFAQYDTLAFASSTTRAKILLERAKENI